MRLDKNGAVITKVVSAQISNLGHDFVCMWDDEGLPIHIHKDVIDYSHNGIHPQPSPSPKPLKSIVGIYFFRTNV